MSGISARGTSVSGISAKGTSGSATTTLLVLLFAGPSPGVVGVLSLLLLPSSSLLSPSSSLLLPSSSLPSSGTGCVFVSFFVPAATSVTVVVRVDSLSVTVSVLLKVFVSSSFSLPLNCSYTLSPLISVMVTWILAVKST